MPPALRRNLPLIITLVMMPLVYFAFERLVSDVATRVRYALRNEAARMHLLREDTRVMTIRPNGWPDGCRAGSTYRLVLSPYKGNKQVPAADIDVHCAGGRHHYWTGTELIVPAELAVEKGPDDEVRITLRRTPAGIEIVDLK